MLGRSHDPPHCDALQVFVFIVFPSFLLNFIVYFELYGAA